MHKRVEKQLDDPKAPITIVYDFSSRERREAANLLARSPGKRGRVTTTSRTLWSWLIFVIVAAALFMWLKQSQPPRPRRAALIRKPDVERWSQPDQIAIGMLATGAACFGLLFVLAVRWARQSRSRWDGQLCLAFDDRGVTQRRPGRTELLRWIGVRGFEEGPMVFVLRSDKQHGIVVPKRLLATNEQCDRLRELLRRHTIRPAVPIPLGFEVGQP